MTILQSMPGVGALLASTLLAEIGSDTKQVPTAAQLVSWAELYLQLRESAGKRKSTRVRKGATGLKPVLVQAAWSRCARKTPTCGRSSTGSSHDAAPKKAIVAVAASMLKAAFHMLRDGTLCRYLDTIASTRPPRTRPPRDSCGASPSGNEVALKPTAALTPPGSVSF
jgi:transposase